MARALLTNLVYIVTLIVTKVVTIIAVTIEAGISIHTIRICWTCMSSIFTFVIFDTFCASLRPASSTCQWICIFITSLFQISTTFSIDRIEKRRQMLEISFCNKNGDICKNNSDIFINKGDNKIFVTVLSLFWYTTFSIA